MSVSPDPRLTNLPDIDTIRLPARHVDGSPLSDEEMKTCVTLLNERLNDARYEPPGVILTVMGRDGHPETFRAVAYRSNGSKNFSAIEQYAYKPEKHDHVVGPGYEPLIELQFMCRRPVQETTTVQTVSTSQPQELVALFHDLMSASQARQEVLSKAATTAQERASVEQANTATVMGELAQVLRDKETGGKTAVHTWAKDDMFLRLHLRMPVAYDTRCQFPELYFPGKDKKASMGFCTEDVLIHYAETCRVATRMMKLAPGDTVRRAEYVSKLSPIGQCYYPLLTWGSTGTLGHRDAFYLALEWMQLPQQANDKKLRTKFAQAMLVTSEASDATDNHALKHGLKSVKFQEEMDGFVLPSSWTLGQRRLESIESTFNVKQENPWFTGGAPRPQKVDVPTTTGKVASKPPVPQRATQPAAKTDGCNLPHRVPVSVPTVAVPTVGARPGGGVTQSKVVNSFSRAPERPFLPPRALAGGGVPEQQKAKCFYKDMQPCAYIHDWILNLVGSATVSAFGSAANVLFPDAIRQVLEGDEFDLRSGECLAPLLVKGDHWVLLHILPDEIIVYDSLRIHTSGDARVFALLLKQKVPALKNARVCEVTDWQQQGYGTNDCGLFTMRAMLHAVAKLPRDICLKEFTREFLDGILPRYSGTQTSVKAQGAIPSAMRHDFMNKVRMHFGKAPIPYAEPLPPLPVAAAMVPAATIPAGVPPATVSPTVCAWGSHLTHGMACGASVKHTHGVQCSQCKAKFCGRHASTWHNKSTWRCPVCRPAWQSKGQALDAVDYSMPPDPDGNPDALRPDFRSGQENPHLANKQGSLVPQLLLALTKAAMHPLAMKGVTEQTRTEHQSLLSRLAKAPPHTHRWPAARIALEVLETGRKESKWCWGTMANKTGLMAAALNRLPEYTKGAMDPLILRFEQEWTDAGRHIRRLSHQTATTGLPGVKEADLMTALETAPTPSIKALLLLSWATVARCGDASQVKTSGLEIDPPNAEKKMTRISVFFDKGKVIGKIDPYHIVTEIPETLAAWLREWHQSLDTVFLFQQTSKAQRAKFLATVREHLRTINADYDLRGVRRGAAQTMAAQGATMEAIRYYTKHVDVAMLRRYLRYGKAPSEETRQGVKTGSKLWSTSC